MLSRPRLTDRAISAEARRRCYLGRDSQKMLSRPRLIECAISAEAHRRCYLGRDSQKMLSRPRLIERAISAEAHRTCYLGRGPQNVLSRPGLSDAISAEAHRTCYFRRVFFSSNFVVIALRAPWLNLYFYRIGVWKSWKILHIILWRWFWQFTIHRRVAARRPISVRRVKTSHLSSARKNVPSQLGAWKLPISARRVKTSHLNSVRENVPSRAFRI